MLLMSGTESASAPQIEDVQAYWESHPLLSYEFEKPGSPKFFDELDRVKREDIERFAMKYWGFPAWRDKSVLDIGCGPGWVTVQYAAAGAKVTSVDLTQAAVDLCKKHLAYRGLDATVRQANAEELPFPDNHFDMVFSSGVLHHTPDTQKSFRESFRVLRPGGTAKITLYRLGILHSPAVFALTRGVMKLLGVKHPGADLGREATSVADFIRQYDGKDNPIGIAKSDRDWAKDLEAIGYRVLGWESHFFPKRFVPAGKTVPSFIHHALDRSVGTMVYFDLRKPG
jgi:SAM-dependent methyltransferase